MNLKMEAEEELWAPEMERAEKAKEEGTKDQLHHMPGGLDEEEAVKLAMKASKGGIARRGVLPLYRAEHRLHRSVQHKPAPLSLCQGRGGISGPRQLRPFHRRHSLWRRRHPIDSGRCQCVWT